jgi:hypothetical protein
MIVRKLNRAERQVRKVFDFLSALAGFAVQSAFLTLI